MFWNSSAVFNISTWFSQDIGFSQILGLVPLDSFFPVIQRLHYTGWCHVSSHQQLRMILFPPGSLPNLFFVDLWWWPLWVVKFDFPLSFWLTFLQHLGNISIKFCGGDLHLLCVCVCVHLKGYEHNLPLAVGFLKVSCVSNFSPVICPAHFLGAVVIPHSRLCHTPVQESDRSLLSLQGWDSIPSQGGWGS